MAKCRVFTPNDVIEVNAGPFNVRESFGDRAVLLDSFGTLIVTDEWGVTLNPLYYGADYYLVCNFFLSTMLCSLNILLKHIMSEQHLLRHNYEYK